MIEESNKAPSAPIEEKPSGTAKGPETRGEKFLWTPKSFFFSYAWLGILLVGLDALTKWLAVLNCGVTSYVDGGGLTQYSGQRSFTVIPNFFSLSLTLNQGAAWSAGADKTWARYVFIAISWIASIAIPFFYCRNLKKKDSWINVVFALCWAGALGNAIDRTFYWPATVGFSGVIDFLAFTFGSYHFPTFNLADSCLVVGIIVFLVLEIVRDIKEKKEGK